MELKPISIPIKKDIVLNVLSPIKRYPIKDDSLKSPNKYDILSSEFIIQNQRSDFLSNIRNDFIDIQTR